MRTPDRYRPADTLIRLGNLRAPFDDDGGDFAGGDPLAPARGILVAILATLILVAIAGAGLWIGAAQLAKVSRIEQETIAGSSYRSIRTASAEAGR